MKTNEVPEKIYIQSFNVSKEDAKFERLLYFDDIWTEEPEPREENIEYTRTDAFIEKALKWYCLDCACNDNCAANHKCAFWSFFKDYLEGNDKALPPKIGNAFNPDGSTTENYRYRHIIERMQDDFIEKATEWLKKNADYYTWYDETERESGMIDGFIDDFRNYMKEE